MKFASFRGFAATLFAVMLYSRCVLAGPLAVESPDGHIRLVTAVSNGVITYRVAVDGRPLIAESNLGPLFADGGYAWDLKGSSESQVDEVRRPVFGKRSRVVNSYRQLMLQLIGREKSSVQSVSVYIRVFNDGFAVCYELGKAADKSRVSLAGERTEFNFVSDARWSWYRPERAPAGPRKASAINGPVSYPVVAELDDNLAVALTEAELKSYPRAVFYSKAGHTGFGLVKPGRPLRLELPFRMPWRVVMIGRSPAQLLDSDIVANLNPAADPDDFKWVRSGVALWDWRAWGYKTDDGFTYGLNLESWKRMIDFAAEQGIPYLLLDADWYGKEFSKNSNPFSGGRAPEAGQRCSTW